MNKKNVALMLAIKMLMNPAVGFAAAPTIPGFYGNIQPPAVNTLPVARGTAFSGVGSITTDANNQMTINQNQASATINWDSFNIGSKATVYFSQKNAQGVAQKDWTALNRIYDRNPSLIFGALKADGRVYLINQNGILFGPGSQVNVNTLIASTMNMRDPDFLNGVLKFTAENYQDTSSSLPATYSNGVAVSNWGSITAAPTGSVYLLGPYVENGGTITAPQGSVKLISALPVDGARPADSVDYDIRIESNNAVTYNSYAGGGAAYNLFGGSLISESGNIGMYGRTVNNDGLIRSVTSVKINGVIELRATDSVTTGASSVIESPISDSADTVNPSYFWDASRYVSGDFGGQVTIAGLTTAKLATGSSGESLITPPLKNITLNGTISAQAGRVTLLSSDVTSMENGSLIDVSGLWVDKPAGAAVVDAQLDSVELRDDYGQKNGTLSGSPIQTSLVNGSSIGNINGSLTGRDMTARDAATRGGWLPPFQNHPAPVPK